MSLDGPTVKYMTGVPNGDVTLRQLSYMTSGIPVYAAQKAAICASAVVIEGPNFPGQRRSQRNGERRRRERQDCIVEFDEHLGRYRSRSGFTPVQGRGCWHIRCPSGQR